MPMWQLHLAQTYVHMQCPQIQIQIQMEIQIQIHIVYYTSPIKLLPTLQLDLSISAVATLSTKKLI